MLVRELELELARQLLAVELQEQEPVGMAVAGERLVAGQVE